MRGRGSDDVTTVHHLFDFRRWRCPNGGALQLRKAADPGLMNDLVMSPKFGVVSGRTRQVSLFTCDAQKDGVCFGGKNDDVFSKPSILVHSISDVTQLNTKIALN